MTATIKERYLLEDPTPEIMHFDLNTYLQRIGFRLDLLEAITTPVAAVISGTIIQEVYLEDGDHARGNTVTPRDDTIPQQSTETTIFMELSITPTKATNFLVVEGVFNCSGTTGDAIVGVWRDSTQDAIAIYWGSPRTASVFLSIPFRVRVLADSTAETTFKVGAGPTAAGEVDFNGYLNARNFGGAFGSTLTITERQA